jgi:hypothetical protein
MCVLIYSAASHMLQCSRVLSLQHRTMNPVHHKNTASSVTYVLCPLLLAYQFIFCSLGDTVESWKYVMIDLRLVLLMYFEINLRLVYKGKIAL